MRSTLVSLFVIACVYAAHTGCASSSGKSGTAASTLCKPNQEVYCRCQDFGEGSKTCSDDGQSYGPCLPCPGAPPQMDAGDPGPEDAGVVDAHADSGDAGSLCGNKKVDPNEACDDGNAVNDDGCNMSCMPAGGYPASAGICPGMAIAVWGAPVTFPSTTKVFPLTYRAKAACGGATGSLGSDRVFVVTPHATGTLTVKTAGATFDVMLYARSDCTTESSELACQNATAGAGDETMSLAATNGTPIYVFVDGATNTTGDLSLTFSIK